MPVAAPPVATPASLDEALPALEGVDVAGGMKRLGLPWTAYRKLLVRFAASTVPVLDELRRAVAAGDGEASRRHAHSIAGSGGNVSAVRLAQLANSLELAAKDGKGELAALLAEVEAEAQRVFESVATLGAETSAVSAGPPPAGEPDTAALERSLGSLAEALAAADLDAINESLEAVRALPRPSALGAQLDRLAQLISDYEHEEALAVAKRVIDALRP